MKNVTVSLPEETARWVRDEAAKPGRSESAWLAGVLSDKKCRSDEYAAAMERRLAIEPRKPTREELHDRTGLR